MMTGNTNMFAIQSPASLQAHSNRRPGVTKRSAAAAASRNAWRLHAAPEQLNGAKMREELENKSSIVTDK